jgi:hypothetical protein
MVSSELLGRILDIELISLAAIALAFAMLVGIYGCKHLHKKINTTNGPRKP